MTWPLAQLIDAWRVARTKYPAPPPPPPDPPIVDRTPLLRDELARRALELAIADLGCGEEGGNNQGPHVARYVAPAKCPANWCAGSVGYWYEQAANAMGITLPFQRSLGAKALGKNVAAVGRRFTDPAQAKPGDLMIFDRGARGSWMGHVGLVETVDPRHVNIGAGVVGTIEGNTGPKVMRRLRRAWPEERFVFFASVRLA